VELTTKVLLILMIFAVNAGAQQMLGFTYDVSVPTGETREFISATSVLGFGLDGRQMRGANFSVGLSFHWNTFHEKGMSWNETEQGLSVAIEDPQMEAFPILLSGHYYFGDPAQNFHLFLGGNIGTYFIISRQTEAGKRYVNKAWHFGLAPDAGFMIDFISDIRMMLSVRYNHAFRTGSSPKQSYFSIIIGFVSVSFL
jgi:hypothetical protein